jgi:membrane associated rhomboid family serine protease
VINLLAAGDFRINEFLALQADLPRHPLKIWELVTYGFVHDGMNPWHILNNMLMLWFFGQEVEYLLGRAEFYRFYFTALVLAGLGWLIGTNLFPDGGLPMAARHLVGASGAVMAVFAVFVWNFPHQTVYVMGVLPVPVWALGLLYLVVDVQGSVSGGSSVAHTAHVAGAAFGLLYAWRGWNLGDFGDFGDLQTRLGRMRRGMRVVRPPEDDDGPPGTADRRGADRGGPDRDADDRRLDDEVDRILEKISRSGESSLTRAERDTLTQASRRLKERQRTFQVDKRTSYNGMIKNILNLEFQLEACPCLESALRRRYGKQVEGLTTKDYWVFFRSPAETWRKMCGCEGWFVFDYEKLKTKAFIVTIRN